MGLARCLAIVCAVALGVGAFTTTQLVMKQDEAIKKFQLSLQRFILALTVDPAGLLVWGLIATLLFPVTLLMYAEAGRYGAKGLVKWPVLGTGSTRQGRVWMAMLLVVPITAVEKPGRLSFRDFQIYVFYGSSSTKAWTICAGLLTGPGLPFLGLLLWPFPAPDKETSAGEQAVKLLKGAYRFFMLPSMVGYYFLIYHAYLNYATPKDVLESIWGPKANGSVMFMTVDTWLWTDVG
eukprot:Skav214432  [mRNA]  locus=scaffold586:393674:397982:+ [translate_table: standard]